MTNTEMIIELLKAYDPDQLAEYAKTIQKQEKEKKADAAKKAQVEEARKKVVEAMKEYNKALYGTEADVKIMDNFNTDLKEIERKAREIEKSFVEDDERIKRFLRGII